MGNSIRHLSWIAQGAEFPMVRAGMLVLAMFFDGTGFQDNGGRVCESIHQREVREIEGFTMSVGDDPDRPRISSADNVFSMRSTSFALIMSLMSWPNEKRVIVNNNPVTTNCFITYVLCYNADLRILK